MAELGEPRTLEQRVVDDLLPSEMEWEETVRTYPLISIALAAAAGFLVGCRSGRAILATVGDAVVARVDGVVHDLVDDERS